MLDVLMIALLQAVAGAPNPPEQGGEPAPVAAETQTPNATAAETAPAPRQRRQRVCQEIQVTGNRIPQRVCQSVMVPAEPEEPTEQAQQAN